MNDFTKNDPKYECYAIKSKKENSLICLEEFSGSPLMYEDYISAKKALKQLERILPERSDDFLIIRLREINE